MPFQECTYIFGIHNVLWPWLVQFDYMLCEKAFPSVHLKSSPLQAVILEVPSALVCVFIFDHIFAFLTVQLLLFLDRLERAASQTSSQIWD